IDQLGVSEPTIQEHGLGEYQILVQLPGIDDPGRVKEIMQSTAILEIRQAFAGPYDNEQAAMAANNGVLPADQVLVPRTMSACGKAAGESGGCMFLVSRTAAVSGRDLRDARPTQDENGR